MNIFKRQEGQTLIEILLVIALAAILFPALLTGLLASKDGKVQQKIRAQAVALMKEGEEATRNIRNQDWNLFAVNGTFHPEISSTVWTLESGTEIIDGLTRSIQINDVYRDTNGNIVEMGGTLDPSTKEVTVTVSWDLPQPSSVTSTFYLVRLDNLSFTQTTEEDFDQGENENTQVLATNPPLVDSDGEIILSQTGGFGDWCNPGTVLEEVDLPKSGVANAISAIQGQASAGTGENASGVSYANLTINDPPYPTPPTASILGTFSGYKTNGVFNEENYAYLATDTNSQQGVIIDLTNLSGGVYGGNVAYGTLNAGTGSVRGQSIYVSNNIAYLTTNNNRLLTFDVTNRSGSHSILGTMNLAGVGNKVVVMGSVAYVATGSTTNQLQIIDVSNPASPTLIRNISVNGNGARDVFINNAQNRAYLVTAQSSTNPEFFLIDLTTEQIDQQVIGTYDTSTAGNTDPRGVIAVSGARAIIVGTGGTEYQVVSLTNESTPSYCGGREIPTGAYGISTVFTEAERAYSYIITGDASTEFKILEGGPGAGNGNFVPTGTYISGAFGPTNFDTAFNKFSANISQPTAEDLQFQIAVADAIGSPATCEGVNYTFIGTDDLGTGEGHFFTTTATGNTVLAGAIPLGSYPDYYENPSKCFKYKVILNTIDSTLTPVFKDLTVNYSP